MRQYLKDVLFFVISGVLCIAIIYAGLIVVNG
jgi:hypothetical protein